MIKKLHNIFLAVFVGGALTACSKDDAEPVPQYDGITVIEGNLEIAGSQSFNNNPRCYLDLVTGATYRVGDAPANAATVDMVLGTGQGYNEPLKTYVISPSNNEILAVDDASVWQDSELFMNWPVRNASLFALHGSKDFTTIVNNIQLDEFIGDTETTLNKFQLNSDYDLTIVYVFKVKRGDVNYKGAIKFDLTNGNDGDFKFIIKVKQE